MKVKQLLAPLLLLILAGGCGTDETGPAGLDDLAITSWGPDTVLQGSRLELGGAGFVPAQLGEMTVHLQGEIGSNKIDHTAPLVVIDDTLAWWEVDSGFIAQTVAYETPFTGTLTVSRKVLGYSGTDRFTLSVNLSVRRNLTPVLAGITPDGVYVGDTLQVQATDLLLPGEGQSLLVLNGDFQVASPPMTKPLHGIVFPLTVESRTRGSFALAPDKFGINPGDFVGEAVLENYTAGSEAAPSNPLPDLNIHVYSPVIDQFTPDIVRRGQRVHITGRGFVPTDAVGESATLIQLEGVFQTSGGKEISYQGKNAMLLFPEVIEGNTELEVILRVTVGVDGQLDGLGLVPGTFTGTAFPELFFGSESFLGQGLDFSLTVAPQLQVVYVKFLPSFDESFHAFGLHEARAAIKDRIVARCNRDYSAYNVDFVLERPVDFAEYSVIELSGQDPNGANLLGLDNTTGKDTNNLRFNDIVGGKNAETEEQGYYAYGGVFLESFLMFSPTISKGKTGLASPRFDETFASFVPELGGSPAEPGELNGGARAPQLQEAVRVLGNLVGGTVAHEIGHSLGLAMVPSHEAEYHNLGDNPAWLMDAGNYRPFTERAEVDGEGPEVFSPYNFDYLNDILPKG
jgi:hypothetical protein